MRKWAGAVEPALVRRRLYHGYRVAVIISGYRAAFPLWPQGQPQSVETPIRWNGRRRCSQALYNFATASDIATRHPNVGSAGPAGQPLPQASMGCQRNGISVGISSVRDAITGKGTRDRATCEPTPVAAANRGV